MAKVAFTKLGLKVDDTVNTLNWIPSENKEAIQIEVKSYLPIEEKIELIMNVINNSVDENNFYNPVRIKIFLGLEIMYHYTNINFTDKMKENPFKLYDLIISTKLYNKVIALIADDLDTIVDTIWETVDSIYSYKNSVMGILDTISTDYSNLKFDASEIQKELADPDNISLLRAVLDKLG